MRQKGVSRQLPWSRERNLARPPGRPTAGLAGRRRPRAGRRRAPAFARPRRAGRVRHAPRPARLGRGGGGGSPPGGGQRPGRRGGGGGGGSAASPPPPSVVG